MSEKKEEKEIKTLKSEIKLIQIEKFVNDFDNTMNKELKSRFKTVILVTGPLILSLIGFLILKNPTLLVIGTSITGVGGIINISKEFIKELKSLSSNSPKTNSNIIKIKQDTDVDKILEDGIGKEKDEDFYSQEFKSALKEEKKYKETLEIQQNNPKLKILNNKSDYLNKDKAIRQILEEIDTYRVIYNLPSLKISNSQWDIFFDIMYNFFENKGLQQDFYQSISQIVRLTFAKSLLNKKNEIGLPDLSENLYYLENKLIKKAEIVSLQQDILSNLPPIKVINFLDTMPEKSRK